MRKFKCTNTPPSAEELGDMFSGGDYHVQVDFTNIPGVIFDVIHDHTNVHSVLVVTRRAIKHHSMQSDMYHHANLEEVCTKAAEHMERIINAHKMMTNMNVQ